MAATDTAPLARADVILIGDSYVEGLYVSDDQVVSSFLQARLSTRGQPRGGGLRNGPGARRAEAEWTSARATSRDLVLFEGNDLYNDREFSNTLMSPRDLRPSALTEALAGGAGPSSAAPTLSSASPCTRSCHGTVPFRDIGGRSASCSAPRQTSPWNGFEQGLWKQTRGTLREAARVTQAHGVNLLLVYVPIKFRGYRDFVDLPPQSEARDWTLWPLPELFTQFCRAEGLVHLDLTECFAAPFATGGATTIYAAPRDQRSMDLVRAQPRGETATGRAAAVPMASGTRST